MKKIIFLKTFIFIVTIILFNINVYAQTLLFQEDFESFNAGDFPTGWTNQWSDAGTIKVQDTLVSQGYKAIKVTGLPNECKGIYKTGTFYPQDVDLYFDLLVPSGNSTAQMPTYLMYGGIQLTTNITTSNTFIFNNNGANSILTGFNEDTWYSFKLQVDYDNTKYRLICLTTNDTSDIYSFTPDTTGNWASAISLYGNNHTSGNNTGFYDAIYLYSANYDSTFNIVCETTEPLVTNNFALWSYHTDQYEAATTGLFEETIDGLKFYGTGYREGSFIHYTPYDKYPIDTNTIFYLKWLAHGPSGYYMGVNINLITDTVNATAISATHFTTDHTYNGSVFIDDDTWYYTKLSFANDSAYAVTSTGNYIDQGGTLFNPKNS